MQWPAENITQEALAGKRPLVCSAQQARSWFDSLSPAVPELLVGEWSGRGLWTGHPLDGVLEACHWAGKAFMPDGQVQPLVMQRLRGGTACLPGWVARFALPIALRLPWLARSRFAGNLVQLLLPLLATKRPQARLDIVGEGDSRTAAIVYDDAPITDVLKKVNDGVLAGRMDAKASPAPLYFVLSRTASAG